MFGRLVSGFKQALVVQSEPPTPMPGSPIPGGVRATAQGQQGPPGRVGSIGALDGTSPSHTPVVLLEGLSEVEKFHILNVMARAESTGDAGPIGPVPDTGAGAHGRVEMPMEKEEPVQRKENEPTPIHQASAGPVGPVGLAGDIPLDGLTEQERAHILRVMAMAESNAEMAPTPDHTPANVNPIPPPISPIDEDPMLSSQLENSGLEEWELAQIMNVMKKARKESDTERSLQPVPDDEQEQNRYEPPVEQKQTPPIRQDWSKEEKEEVDFNEDPGMHPVSTEGYNKEEQSSSDETEGADEPSPVEESSFDSSPIVDSEENEESEKPEHDFVEDFNSKSIGPDQIEVSKSPDQIPIESANSNYWASAPIETLERVRIESIEPVSIGISRLAAGLDDPALAGLLPEGIELLSVEEQEQIIAVLKRAVMEYDGETRPVPPAESREKDSSYRDNETKYGQAQGTEPVEPVPQWGGIEEYEREEMQGDRELQPGRFRESETELQLGRYKVDETELQLGQFKQDETELQLGRFEKDETELLEEEEEYQLEEKEMQREENLREEDKKTERPRVPDLKFEMSEEPQYDETEAIQEGWNASNLGGMSPVSIMIQPPSPCPTDESGSDDEDYWTRANKIRRKEEEDRMEEEESEYDQPRESGKRQWPANDQYEPLWSGEEEQEQEYGEEGGREDVEWTEDQEGFGIQEETQEQLEEEPEIEAESNPLVEEEEEEEAGYVGEEIESEKPMATLMDHEIADVSSPVSDRVVEYGAVEDDAGNEADNEGERYDRFETDVVESPYEDSGSVAASYYGTTVDYYAPVEYQRSESGSSSGYGSRGVLGLSSYTSGEGLSQQSAASGLFVETGTHHGTGTHQIVPDVFNMTGSYGGERENVETKNMMDQFTFQDFMTKSAPTENVQEDEYDGYQNAGEIQSQKMEPSGNYYEKEEWTAEPIPYKETVESESYPEFNIEYSRQLEWREKQQAAINPIPAEEPQPIEKTDSKYSFGEDQQQLEESSDGYPPGHGPDPKTHPVYSDTWQSQSSAYGQQERPNVHQSAQPSIGKSPERSSFFSSLKQAATSPAPKSAFGSLFSGASQALKSQTEAVLKKAVDTVSQVAAASELSPKHIPPTPPPTSVTAPTQSKPAAAPSTETQPARDRTGSMETVLGDYDYDSPYSLTRMIKHEPILPVKEEIVVQHVQQPAYGYDWTVDRKVTVQPEPKPLAPASPAPAPATSTVIEVPGMPDLDLSQFNEEERAHLMAMIGKAKEMEAELHSTPSSATPSRSTSFSQHGTMTPISTVIEEEEVDEEAQRSMDSYKTEDSGHKLPWSVPSIREIGATPECHVDVEEAFAAASVADTSNVSVTQHQQQQQYDSSEVSSAMCEDEDDQQQRMTEIEADLRGDGGQSERYKMETPALADCPLCKRYVLRCTQGSYGTTGQMCADCGVVVCTECGSVVPRYLGKVWLCSQCQLEEQAQIQIQQQQQQQFWHEEPTEQQRRGMGGQHGKSSAAKRRRRRTTAIGQRHEDEEDEESKFGHSVSGRSVARDGNDSDESDEEASSRRDDGDDDDDYPDEVIEVPPAPLSPDAQGAMQRDNGNVDGGGLGADVLAAIASTFSSSSSDFPSFNDVLVDSSPGRQAHLQQQQQQQIAFTMGASLTQTAAPPPVPARAHRVAPPPPTVPQQRQEPISSAVSAPGQFPHAGWSNSGPCFDSTDMSWEMGQETGGGGSKAIGSVDGALDTAGTMFERVIDKGGQTGLREHVDSILTESQEQEQMEGDTRSGMVKLSGSEDEQMAMGESEEEEEEEEEEQIDYAQAMKYYNNNPFFTHRPGPVYTIPEDEESDELGAETGHESSQHYRDGTKAAVSPDYQLLMKQHQQQQLIRQQQQQKLQQQLQQQQVDQQKQLETIPTSQPSTVLNGSIYHKRNPFIEEEEEYENVDNRYSGQESQATPVSQPAPVSTCGYTREVTSLVSSQQYFASQQEQQRHAALNGSSTGQIASSSISTTAAATVRVGKASMEGGSSINSLTQATTSVTSTNYAPVGNNENREGEYAGRQQRPPQQRADAETRYTSEQGELSNVLQRHQQAQPQPQAQLHQKRQTAGTGQSSIDYSQSTVVAKTETGGSAAVPGRPTLAFVDDDIGGATGHSHVQQAPTTKEKTAITNLTPASSSEELFYSQGIPGVGKLIWQRDDQQEIPQQQQQQQQQQQPTMTASHASTGSRSSEDEEALDLDNQFVSKLKRSPAMILHADAAVAGRRPPGAAGVQQQQPPSQQQQQPEYLEDIVTDEAPVAWPTFMGQKTPAPHQLPPFPPPPVGGGTRQRFPSGSAEDQSSLVASTGSTSAPSLTISASGGGAVPAASGRGQEMGRRKLPSIPQTASASGMAQSEQPYGVRSHYGSVLFDVEQRLMQQQQQVPILQEGMSSNGAQNWRNSTNVPTSTAQSKDQRLRLAHTTPSLRMPATLARVLLKQELREALSRRQQQLEACEIEANQRQYSVQRYLHTGIYPPSIGLQPNIPRTVLSTLPPELLAGCKIHYRPPPPSSVRATSAFPSSTYCPSGGKVDNGTYIGRPVSSSFGSSTPSKHISSPLVSYRDAGVMTEPENLKTSFLSGRLHRTTVTSKNNSSMTIQFQDAETQTWATTGSATFLSSAETTGYRNNKDSSYGRTRFSSAASAGGAFGTSATSKTVSTSTEDLDREREHAQSLLKKQHRKLRATASASSMSGPLSSSFGYYSASGAQRDHHHQSKRLSAYFSDEEDDSLTREMRKTKIKDEIARRRQNLGPSMVGQNQPMTDYGSSTLNALSLPQYYASDYSSHVPHYGSLPRMDFPSRHQYGAQQMGEGPAPMMRSIGVGGSTMDNFAMQPPYLPPPRRAVSVSGDGEYYSGWRNYGHHHPLNTGRGGLGETEYFSDFGDYMSMSARGDTAGLYTGPRPLHSSSAGTLRQMSSSAPYLNALTDPVNYNRPTVSGTAGTVGDSGLLSHYASYLNREFANSASGSADTYNQSWRRPGAHESTLATETAFPHHPTVPSQNAPGWPTGSNFTTDSHPGSSRWRSSMPLASAYRSGIYEDPRQTFPTAGMGVGVTPSAATDSALGYGYSTIPDRSTWFRNTYRPAYQHVYPPPAPTGSLPTARSLDALRSGFGLANSRAYTGAFPHRTPYWSPLEISAVPGSFGGDLMSGGSYASGGGFGNAIRYDSGYSSGGAGAGYASDSYHSNIGGLSDRQQQSTMGRSMGYSGRAPWSSTGSEMRPNLNSMSGYVSDSTLERRRFKMPDYTSGNYETLRSMDAFKHLADGSRIKRVLLTKMGKEKLSNGSGLGMKIVGGKIIPGTDGELGAFVTNIHKGGLVDTLGEVKEGDQIMEWNGVMLTGKTYEEVQRVIENSHGEVEIVLRSFDNNNNNKHLRLNEIRHDESETDYGSARGHRKVTMDTIDGTTNGTYFTRQVGLYSDTMMDGKASPCFSTTPRSRSPLPQGGSFVTGLLRSRIRFDCASGTLFVHVLSARDLRPRSVTASTARSGYPNPFVKIYLLPGRIPENKRRTKFVSNTCNPEWDQTVVYKDLRLEDLPGKYLEFTVWDYDRFVENQFLGRVVLPLADPTLLSGIARYYPLQPLA